MRVYFVSFFLLNVLCASASVSGASAITFAKGGRLGDQLMNYFKAKWLSYRYNIPFLCPDFPYKETLVLSKKESALTKKKKKKFAYSKQVHTDADLVPLKDNTLYVSTIHAKPVGLHSAVDTLLTFNQHPKFLQTLRERIAPCTPVLPLDIPQGIPTLAVHVRRGGGYDLPLLHENKRQEGVEYADVKCPTRFAPDQYYLAQIEWISALLDHQSLYVHIFTDDKKPRAIVKKYKKALGLPNLIFGYRKKGNSHTANVLDDLFAMTQFDYFIRSTSNFSLMASILGNHRLIIWPKHATWYDNYLVIDRIWLVHRHQDGSMTKEALTIDYSNRE